jgi:hypothetical protein
MCECPVQPLAAQALDRLVAEGSKWAGRPFEQMVGQSRVPHQNRAVHVGGDDVALDCSFRGSVAVARAPHKPPQWLRIRAEKRIALVVLVAGECGKARDTTGVGDDLTNRTPSLEPATSDVQDSKPGNGGPVSVGELKGQQLEPRTDRQAGGTVL